jgi:hypothetical protein
LERQKQRDSTFSSSCITANWYKYLFSRIILFLFSHSLSIVICSSDDVRGGVCGAERWDFSNAFTFSSKVMSRLTIKSNDDVIRCSNSSILLNVSSCWIGLKER